MNNKQKNVISFSTSELDQISGGFNPIKYRKYVVNEVVKGFRQAW